MLKIQLPKVRTNSEQHLTELKNIRFRWLRIIITFIIFILGFLVPFEGYGNMWTNPTSAGYFFGFGSALLSLTIIHWNGNKELKTLRKAIKYIK